MCNQYWNKYSLEFKSVHVSLSIANNASKTIQNVTEETIEILSIDRNVNWIINDKYIRTMFVHIRTKRFDSIDLPFKPNVSR